MSRIGRIVKTDAELKPCPFCGGKCCIVMVQDRFYAMCDTCTCRVAGPLERENTAAEAITAWNTRAERTCKASLNESRTAVVCSECGSSSLLKGWEEIRDWEQTTRINTFTTFNFCPDCGAKVVEE